MEVLDDDFGELYADVEGQASSSINVAPELSRLELQQEVKEQKSIVFASSPWKSNDLIGKELIQSDEDNRANTASVSDMDGKEDDEEKELIDNGSESDDDLNIVLNDDGDDCRLFHGPGIANLSNEGTNDDEDDPGHDDEMDDFSVVRRGNGGSSNNDKWDDTQMLGDGLEQRICGPGADRGNVVKAGYYSQYSQYKYVRSHPTGFLSNTKANGSLGLAWSSAMIARGDCETHGSSRKKSSSSGPSASAKAVPVLARSGYGFSLPWYRSIFDVDIDKFDHKPWRQPGVDMTEFFNYGFDEESWKSYCSSLPSDDWQEQFQRQKVMEMGISANECFKANQECKARYEHETETVPEDAVSEKLAQNGKRKRVPAAQQFDDSAVQLSEMPKGRAILVKGSIGERKPSMDIKCPRHQDSDVVIQIVVQDNSTEGLSCSNNEEGDEKSESGKLCIEDTIEDSDTGDEFSRDSPDGTVEKSETSSGTKRRSSPMPASETMLTNSDNQGNRGKGSVHNIEENSEMAEIQDSPKEFVRKITSDADPCKREKRISFNDQNKQRIHSLSLENHSEASEDIVHTDLENTKNQSRRRSSISDIELRESATYDRYPTKESEKHDHETKSKYKKYSARTISPSGWGNRRFPGVAKLKIHPGKRNKRLHDSYDREDVSYHHGREHFLYYYDENADNHFRDDIDIDPYLKKKWDAHDYYREQRNSRMDDEVLEGDWCDRGRRRLDFDDFDHLYKEPRDFDPKYSSSFIENGRDARWRRQADYKFVLECQYGEGFLLGKSVRNFPCRKWERPCDDEDYERHLRFSERGIKYSNRRERHDENADIVLGHSNEGDEYERSLPFNEKNSRYSGRSKRYHESAPTDWGHSKVDDEYWRPIAHESPSSRFCREDDEYWRHTAHRSPSSLFSREDDEYWRHTAHMSLSSPFYGEGGECWRHTAHESPASLFNGEEPYGANGGRWDETSRNPMYDYKLSKTRAWNARSQRLSWQSKENHWAEGDSRFRVKDEEMYDDKMLLSYETPSRAETINANHVSNHGGVLVDHKREKGSYKTKRERHSGTSDNLVSNTIYRDKNEQTEVRFKDSVREEKVNLGTPRLKSRVTDIPLRSNGGSRHINEDWMLVKKNTMRDSNKSDKVNAIKRSQSNKKQPDKYPVTKLDESFDIEEGQILEKEPVKKTCIEKKSSSAIKHTSGSGVQKSYVVIDKPKLQGGNAEDGNKEIGGYDKDRILETIAKMEKRRERFKEPITVKKAMGKDFNPQVYPVVETAETTQQRPARKRRWAGS